MTQPEKLQQIRFRESQLHTNQKTKSGKPLPDEIGYQTEDLMLSDFMTYFSNEYKDKNPVFVRSIAHIENEGNSGGAFGKMQGAISKGKGKKKGWLDVENVYLGNFLFMEFKLKEGKFSDEQLDIISDLVGWNVPIFIIREFDLFWYVITEICEKGIKLPGLVYTSIEQIKTRL